MAGCVFALTTFRRTEKYLPLLELALDRCWPSHPGILVLSDVEASACRAKTLSFPDASWTEIFFRGLSEIRLHDSGLTHVFHMLDDHCPLRACDSSTLETYFRIAAERDLATIAFPTYHWPWSEVENRVYPDGLVRTWRKIDIESEHGRRLAVVPRDFFRYFQVQPAIWKLDYLLAACRQALAAGNPDAWSFEALRWPDAAQHYVADYRWPTVHHGFLASGKVNPEAIGFIDGTLAPELRTQLLRDSIGIASPALHRVLWASEKFGSRVLGRLKNTLVHATEP